MRKLFTALILSLVAVSVQAQTSITGAGATFPYPLYSKWFAEYKKANPTVEINYQSIGSGGGIKQFTAKTVDFGASDAPMTDAEIKSAGGNVIHVPTVLGAVVLTYNVPGLKGLKLTPDVIADIYLGKVTKWNDPRIAAENKGAALPAQDIVAVYRSDSSGTTAVFTDYLSKVSESFKSTVGPGKAVKWPAGVGGKGNEGVTGFVKNTPGSFGYVELAYAESEKLPVAEVKNKAGKYVKPSIQSVTDAAAGAMKAMPEDFRVSITNPDGATAYPISAFTYLLVAAQMDKAKGGEMVKFLNWSMTTGQGMASKLSYSPLPKPLVAKVQKKISTIQLK
jgi:phosphate transport system substrate-binding protein